MSNFEITTYGGGEAIVRVLNGIVMVLSFDSGQSLGKTLIQLIGVVGVIWALALVYIRNSLSSAITWFSWFLLCTTVFILPKTTVKVKDPLSMAPKISVGNVPWVLGAVAGTVSQMMSGITEKVETAFSLPDDLTYQKTGSVFASKLLAKSNEFKVVDPKFNANLEAFVQQCVAFDAMIGQRYTLTQLKTSNNVWGLVSRNASKTLGFTYQHDRGSEIKSCFEGARLLQQKWTEQINKAATYYGKYFFPNAGNDIAKSEFLLKLPASYRALTNMTGEATNLLKQEIMINTIRDAANNKVSEFKSNYALAKAKIQQQSFFDTTGELVGETLPLLKTVFECIAYAAFMFVVFLSLLPGGHKILISYFKELLWIQSWPIFYAVLNMLCTLWAQQKTGAAVGGSDGVTMLNSVAIADANAGMKGIAGWLSLSVPTLSRIIITGSFEGFVHLSNYMASTIQGSASAVSQVDSSPTATAFTGPIFLFLKTNPPQSSHFAKLKILPLFQHIR